MKTAIVVSLAACLCGCSTVGRIASSAILGAGGAAVGSKFGGPGGAAIGGAGGVLLSEGIFAAGEASQKRSQKDKVVEARAGVMRERSERLREQHLPKSGERFDARDYITGESEVILNPSVIR